MRDFFFFFFFFFFGSFSFLRFFRRIFSNFKKISTLSEREREREIFSTKKEKIFTSLHSPSRALFCDAAQKTRIQKKRTRKRERNANRGHESHAFAVASRVRLYRGVHLFLSPHFFFWIVRHKALIFSRLTLESLFVLARTETATPESLLKGKTWRRQSRSKHPVALECLYTPSWCVLLRSWIFSLPSPLIFQILNPLPSS